MPSNFVEAVPDDKMDGKDIEVFAASEEDVCRASQIIKVCIHHTLYMYTHQCMHTHVYTDIHRYTHACTYTRTHARIHNLVFHM